jgi:hypothetical protein
MAPDLHERIAAALGWSVEDARSFGLHGLRDLVRPVSTKLAAEIGEAILTGSVLVGTRRQGRKS